MLYVMGVYKESFSMWDYENFHFGALIESLDRAREQAKKLKAQFSICLLFLVSCYVLLFNKK